MVKVRSGPDHELTAYDLTVVRRLQTAAAPRTAVRFTWLRCATACIENRGTDTAIEALPFMTCVLIIFRDMSDQCGLSLDRLVRARESQPQI